MTDSRVPRPRPHPGDQPARPPVLQVPPLDPATVDWLERMVPEVVPAAPCDLQDLHWHLGRRALVKFIRVQLNKQQESL